MEGEEQRRSIIFRPYLNQNVKVKYQDNGVACAIIGVLIYVDDTFLKIGEKVVSHSNNNFISLEPWGQ